MPPASAVRKFALTAHVAASVGWLGAVVGFLALAIAGVASADPSLVRGAYVGMNLTGWYVIVPLSLLALLTGLTLSLGTTWGLVRHYWVGAKLAITVVASLLLPLHMRVAGHLATAATAATFAAGDCRGLRLQLVGDAVAGLVVLLIATGLSVFKPQGLTPWGRKQAGRSGGVASADATQPATPFWVKLSGLVVAALIVLAVFKHLGGGMHHHH